MTVVNTSSTNELENLETFSLIWLDAEVNDSTENVDAQHQLRASINFLRTFEDDEKCETYIKLVPKDDRIVLITSGRLGQILVPRIHSLRQLSSIYVYCKDKKRHEAWANQFKKVRGVIVLLEELISQIRSDQSKRNAKRVDEPLSINADTTNIKTEQSTSELMGQFVHSQLLIDCLLRMKESLSDKDELIALCREYYKDNEIELSIVNEFEKYYSSDRALWWYTREAFLYRLMNKALRVLNTDLLFLFRFFIRDIEQQMEQRRCLSFIHLYRCQLMSKDEINFLQNLINQYISINSYFSTSTSRDQALIFLHYSSDLERVLFEIDADPQLKGIKPFANITSSSYFPEEEEILFTFGTIFQIVSVDYDDDDELWTIRMSLTSDKHDYSSSIIDQMKNEHSEQEETNILTYGNVLRHMGKIDQAEKYYRRFLDQSPTNPEDIAHCYHALGIVVAAKGNYDSSLHWHNDALGIKMDIFKSDDPKIASSLNSVAIVYRNKGDYQQALQSYNKALIILKKTYGENHSKVIKCLNNIGVVYQYDKSYAKALEYYKMALDIGQKHVSPDYCALSATHNNIGNLYYMIDNYDKALQHYTQSLQIKLKIFPSDHSNIANARKCVAMVQEKQSK